MEDEKTTSIVKIEEMSLDEERLAEQLYYSAPLWAPQIPGTALPFARHKL